MIKTASALALSSLCIPAFSGEQWHADYDVAAKIAEEQGKHLLVDFTGSDWCHWCTKLEEEVFDHAVFEDGVRDDYVLVRLDFPKGAEAKAKVPNPERNQELFDLHSVPFYPTVLLMTSAGEVFGQTGYRPGGPEAYVAFLDSTAEAGLAELKTIRKALADFAAAEGEARSMALTRLLEMLAVQGKDSPFATMLLDPARFALAEGTPSQQRASLDALIAAASIDSEAVDAARRLDPSNEKGLWFRALAVHVTKPSSRKGVWSALAAIDAFHGAGLEAPEDAAAGLYLNAAFWYDRFGSGPIKALEGADLEARKQGDREHAQRYARLAKPLCTHPKQLEVLEKILAD